MIDWTKSSHCSSRLHCDYCPYALGRPVVEKGKKIETPIGPGDTIPEWMVFPLHTDEHQGVEDRYVRPDGGRCPWAITWERERASRIAVVLQRVTDKSVSEADALDCLTNLGIDLEAELTSL